MCTLVFYCKNCQFVVLKSHSMQESLKTFKKFTGVANSSGKMQKSYTLVFVKKEKEILMGLKARGFGVGLWNGFGGKIESNETVEEAAKRELKEECNLSADTLTYLGIVTYEVGDHPLSSVVHVFSTYDYDGEIVAGEEMNPIRWYALEDIPYKNMWPDTKLWYPHMLKDKYFTIYVKYNDDGEIIENHLEELAEPPQFSDKTQ